jgi:hypothetical protein
MTGEKDTPFDSFWKSETCDDIFGYLKTITINSMDSDGALYFLGFMKFVLGTASVLENMIIRDIGVEAVMYGMKTPFFSSTGE